MIIFLKNTGLWINVMSSRHNGDKIKRYNFISGRTEEYFEDYRSQTHIRLKTEGIL